MITIDKNTERHIVQSICAFGTLFSAVTLILDSLNRAWCVVFIFVLAAIALTLHWVNSQEK